MRDKEAEWKITSEGNYNEVSTLLAQTKEESERLREEIEQR